MGLEYDKSDGDQNNSDLIQCVVDLRNELREFAQNESDKEKKKAMFKTGDVYRDRLYNDFSVKIEDKTNLWKFFDKNEKVEQSIPEVVPPEELYEKQRALEKFKEYEKDEQGLPTTDPNGKPISAKNRKYCEKKFNQQKKLYEEYLKKIGK